jgi:hypothetical protein
LENIGKYGNSKVECENVTSLEEKSDKYHDIKDINGENHLLFALTKGDMEENSLFNISNNSFVFHYSQSSDDSRTKEDHEARLNGLGKFHKNNLMEFKPPSYMVKN